MNGWVCALEETLARHVRRELLDLLCLQAITINSKGWRLVRALLADSLPQYVRSSTAHIAAMCDGSRLVVELLIDDAPVGCAVLDADCWDRTLN